MTRVKHIIIIVLMLSAFVPTANAQGSLAQPFEGTVHDYTVDGITTGADYLFYITSDIGGSNVLDDALEVEFDFLDNVSGTIGTDGLATLPIQWNAGASEHIYYLWLEASIDGCANNIRLEIMPQSNLFDLVAENVPLENSVSCPETNPDHGFNPVTGEYFAGSTALEFKVRRENGTLNTAVPGTTYDWSFIPELNVDPDLLGHINVIVSVEEATQDGDRYIVSGAYDEVTVTVHIQNAPGTDLNVSLLLTNQLESNTMLTDNNPDNDRVTHTIQVMPVINGMSGV